MELKAVGHAWEDDWWEEGERDITDVMWKPDDCTTKDGRANKPEVTAEIAIFKD